MASKLGGENSEFAELVARVVLVGAPLAGTMRATEALLWGSEGLGDDEDVIDAARGMARTWPALYQMLPAWGAVLDPDGDELPAGQQFNQIDGWPGTWGAGVQDDLLLRAREGQELLAEPTTKILDRSWGTPKREASSFQTTVVYPTSFNN